MTTLILGVGAVVTLAAAVRSTWSPCGRSMLSTITPLGERARGHRFAVTAGWFVAGAVLGGLCLGALGAALAAAVAAGGLPAGLRVGIAAALLLAGAVLDAGVGGLRLPIHRRQVNERWLDRYRCGVYGLGFGWQIGSGLATYIMTAGVYLVVVLGGLGADPWAALALGAFFGAVRGLAVLTGRRLTTSAALAAFHRRFDRWGEASRRSMVAVEGAGAVVAAGVVWLPAAALVTVLGVLVLVPVAVRRRHRAPAAAAPPAG